MMNDESFSQNCDLTAIVAYQHYIGKIRLDSDRDSDRGIGLRDLYFGQMDAGGWTDGHLLL